MQPHPNPKKMKKRKREINVLKLQHSGAQKKLLNFSMLLKNVSHSQMVGGAQEHQQRDCFDPHGELYVCHVQEVGSVGSQPDGQFWFCSKQSAEAVNEKCVDTSLV